VERKRSCRLPSSRLGGTEAAAVSGWPLAAHASIYKLGVAYVKELKGLKISNPFFPDSATHFGFRKCLVLARDSKSKNLSYKSLKIFFSFIFLCHEA